MVNFFIWYLLNTYFSIYLYANSYMATLRDLEYELFSKKLQKLKSSHATNMSRRYNVNRIVNKIT